MPLRQISAMNSFWTGSGLLGLGDRIRGHEVGRSKIHKSLFGCLAFAVQPLPLGKEVFPLGVRATRLAGRKCPRFRLPTIGVPDQCDHAVAVCNVLLKLLRQRSSVLLKVFLHP